MPASRASAVVLAAGLGTRFGEHPKLIAQLDGKPILQHVLDTLRATGIAPVVVVLGHAIDEVRGAIQWRDEIQVENRHAARGLLRSVLLGLRALDQTWSLPDRTLIVLGDQPLIRREQMEALFRVTVDEERPFLVSRYADGHSGNPVLLEASGRFLVGEFVKRMRAADRGLSQFFHAFPDRVRYVDVPGANPDIDTPEDLAHVEAAQTVARGYDALGADYVEWGLKIQNPARDRMVDEFSRLVPAGAAVLELGCGAGLTATKRLAETYEVTGVDISAHQLEAARRNVPQATFITADMTAVQFPPAAFAGVVALYSIIHVPRTEHSALIAKIARWLTPGGVFLAALSANDSPDWTGDWLGQPMFFSGYDSATNRRLIIDAGFEILQGEEVEIIEPEGPARFLWVLARATPA